MIASSDITPTWAEYQAFGCTGDEQTVERLAPLVAGDVARLLSPYASADAATAQLDALKRAVSLGIESRDELGISSFSAGKVSVDYGDGSRTLRGIVEALTTDWPDLMCRAL